MRQRVGYGLVAATLSVGGLMALAAGPPAPEAPASGKGSGTAGGATKSRELVFMDGFESGDTSAWDYEPTTCTTVLHMPTNLGD